MGRKRPIIVGIDPGMRVGISVIDLYGTPLVTFTLRTPSKSKIIRSILEFGKPLIVACDVNPLPRIIRKVASALGARSFYPETSLTDSEKSKLVRKFEGMVKDSHQKDSLAAALKAYKSYSELFSKVRNELKRIGKEEVYEKVISLLLTKKGENIKGAIRVVLNES